MKKAPYHHGGRTMTVLCQVDGGATGRVNRAIEELQNGVVQAMQPNKPSNPHKIMFKILSGGPGAPTIQSTEGRKTNAQEKRQMSSDEGSSGGSPKRSWAAEEKKEQREVSPRGRHHDRVPSVERVVPSQGDAKGQEGSSEARSQEKTSLRDHRDSTSPG
ncbi:unnamed protein product [Mytilus edulis]|uniref:Uncharacterized protein n=1 Tax=Mytilus edulis TaxID=6550 RepID=A0A8S3U1H5_MYTED|nr:unnamed protein product [Mytilus edulis]